MSEMRGRMAGRASFFVSYTSVDRAWAEWIAWQLEAEGYQVVIQAWDFTAGRDWVHEMQQATVTAERVVVVLSPAYLMSAHGEAEWRVFYAADPSGERGLLIPIRVGAVEPPGLLKTRVYVDLVALDASAARRRLLAAVRGARGKPAGEPEFPGIRSPAASDSGGAPRFPGELPPVWNVPFHINPYFTGREPLLAEVHAQLTAPDPARRRVALTGLGGLGKSQLAVEYAYRQRADYDVVWWVRGEQPTTLLADFAALAKQLHVMVQVGLEEDPPQEKVVEAVRAWLEHHHRWLLVVDNVDNPASVAGLLPRGTTGQVLITSRSGVGWEPLATPLALEVLAPADAAAFLLARTQQTGPAAHDAATTLAATLGCLPLALEQTGAYIAATGTLTLAGYAGLFATRALELLARGQPLGYPHTVATTWSLALQRLEAMEPAAVELLTLAAFLAPDDLPMPLLVAHHSHLSEPLSNAARDPMTLADAVAALRRYSLVGVTGDGLSVHQLLQTVIRGTLAPEAERTWAAAAVHLLYTSFPVDSDEVGAWEQCQRLLPHVLVGVKHAQRLKLEPEQCSWLMHRGARYLRTRGQFRQAEVMAQEALTTHEQALGLSHPDTITLMSEFAMARRPLGDLEGARDMFEQALALRRRVLGDDHPDTLRSLNDLAFTKRQLGDARRARELHEQTLAARRQLLGNDHPDTLTSMQNLAEARAALGDVAEASELFERTLAARRRVLGEDHRDTLFSMQNLAEARAALGDLAGALQLHEQTLAARQRVLGGDHRHTLQSLQKLAEARAALGDMAGACELFEQALAARRRVLGEDHPDTIASRQNLDKARKMLNCPQSRS